ncbi:ribosome maturation factor RimM [Marinilabilia salmonicolor]|uniref:ribosome maturation factor RimM n=1 Tax=Marinilabilia salmonicolor TaxID=989 RepID=UPI00029A118B|nr:ribosome maturation factor RimM [Marinilabilia salmonicolor]
MIEKSEFTYIGKLAKPHGVSGETAIRLTSEVAESELDPTFIFVDIDKGLVPFRVNEFRYKGGDVLLVKLPLLETEKDIRKLMDNDIYISPHEISGPSVGTNNINAFNGFKAIDINEGELGIIESIQDISGNPLFIINGKKGELLIPVAEEFIVNVDEENKTIELNIPEGLLDLNEE